MIKEVALLYETVQKMPEGSRKHQLLKKVSAVFNCTLMYICFCVSMDMACFNTCVVYTCVLLECTDKVVKTYSVILLDTL